MEIINKYKNSIIVLLFSLIYSLLFFYITPFFDSTYQDIDSYVFRNCGYFIKNGLIVYKDFIDNKGPILHLLNYLFVVFEKINLLYIFSLFTIITFNVYIYKIAKLYIDKPLYVVIIIGGVFISLTSQYNYNITNNMTEFFSLPIFAYVYYKYLVTKNWDKLSIVIQGVLFSILFSLRANLVCINVICSILVLFDYLKEKKYKEIINYIVFYIIGITIVMAPIVIYFIKYDALNDTINNYLLYNIMYSAYGAKVSIINNSIISYIVRSGYNFLRFSNNIFIILIYLLFIINIKKSLIYDNLKHIIIYVFCFFSSIFVSNRFHMHYIWIMLPMIIYPICVIINKISINKIYRVFYLLLIISTIFMYGLGFVGLYKYKIKDKGFDKNYLELKSYFTQNVDKNETVFTNIDANNDFYYATNTLTGNKYIYQYFYAYFYENEYYLNRFIDDFKNTPSSYYIEKTSGSHSKDLDAIMHRLKNECNYELVYKNDIYEVYKLNDK